MEADDLFIVLGISLTALALIVSRDRGRAESFPPSRGGDGGSASASSSRSSARRRPVAWLTARRSRAPARASRRRARSRRPAEVMDETRRRPRPRRPRARARTPPRTPRRRPPRPTAPPCSRARAARAATRSRPPAAPPRRARTSTPSWPSEDEADIEESIVDPDAEVAKGFGEGIMPGDFGDTMTPEELERPRHRTSSTRRQK